MAPPDGAGSEEGVYEIISVQESSTGENHYLCLLEKGGKKVRRSESELESTAPKLLKEFKKEKVDVMDITADTTEDDEEEDEVVVLRKSSRKKEGGSELRKRAKEVKEKLLKGKKDKREDGDMEISSASEEEEAEDNAGSYDEDEEEEEEDLPSEEENDSDAFEDKPLRKSTRVVKKTRKLKPQSPLKPSRKSTRSTRHQEPFVRERDPDELDGGDDEIEVIGEGRRTRRSTRSSKSNTGTEEESDDELSIVISGRVGGRKAVKKGKSKQVEEEDDGDDGSVTPIKWAQKDLPQNKHSTECWKCHKGPADEVKKKLLKKKRAPGRRKRNHENADLEEDSDAELERIDKLGAWVDCEVCLVSSHYGCLPTHLQKEFIGTLKEAHEALHPPPPPPAHPEVTLENGMTVDPLPQPPQPPHVIPKREKIEFDLHRKFTIPKCMHCKKAGGRRCFLCGVSGRKRTVEVPAKEVEKDEVAMEVDEEVSVPPIMFRCIKCKRPSHYDCLPREDDDLSIPLEEHAEAYFKDQQCHQCWSYTAQLDVILAWAEDLPETSGAQAANENDADDIVQEVVVTKDEKTGKEFVLPSAKDPTCPAKYLVKWRDQSYRNLEWIPHGYLVATYPSKLSNFLLRGSLINFDQPTDDQLEDDEDEETAKKAKAVGSTPSPDPDAADRIPEAWSTVDRILDVWYDDKYKKSKADPEESVLHVSKCYIKWGDLDYAASTIEEPPEPDEDGYEAYVNAYKAFLIARGPGMRVPTLNVKQVEELSKPRDEAKFRPLKEQPKNVVGGKLMPFQLEGVNFLYFQWWKRTGCILADEMGLGKTVQIITLLSFLNKNQGARPFLVAVPNSTIGNWMREFARWAPDLRVVPYGGSHESLAVVQDYELFDESGKVLKTHVVLATYEALEKNVSIFRKVSRWDVCVIDEGQRLKSGPGGLLYDALCSLNISHRILLTGTPLNNNIRELFALLHFIDPSNYTNLDELAAEYVDLTSEKVENIRSILKPYILRRTKELVLDLPPINELVVPVTMTVLQRQLYRNLLEKNVDAIVSIFQKPAKGNSKPKKASFNNLLMQLRKLLGHPYLVSPDIERFNIDASQAFVNLTEASGKLLLLAKLLPKLKAAGHRVLMFSQFKIVLNILEDFLIGLKLKYLRLDGDTAQLDRQRGIDAYQKEGSEYFAYILSTRAGGVGINLTTADTVIMFDQDFNPHQDVQAIARAHRIGQKKPVRVFKLIVKGTCEEKIFQTGAKKLGLDHVIIQRLDAEKEESQQIETILQYGAKAIFDDQESDANQIKYSDQDIDDLLARSAEVSEKDKDGSAAAFAQAKIWDLKRDDGVAAEASGHDENLHDFWAGILKEKEAEDEAKKVAASQNLGKRRRKDVTYNEKSNLDEDREKKVTKKRAASSDDEFRAEEVRSLSSDSDEDFQVIERPDLAINPVKPPKPKGFAQPYPLAQVDQHGRPLPSYDPQPGPSTSNSTAGPSHASGRPLTPAEIDEARRLEKARVAQRKAERERKAAAAIEATRRDKARIRRENVQALARTAKQLNNKQLDALLDEALHAPREKQKELILQATGMIHDLIARQKALKEKQNAPSGSPLVDKPAVANRGKIGPNGGAYPKTF